VRTAINLQGVEKEQLERGNVLATKDSLRATRMVDVVLDHLKSAPRKLKNRAKCAFTQAPRRSSLPWCSWIEIISTLETLASRNKTRRTCAVLARDRYVLRSYSPVRAIAGGEILNAFLRRRSAFRKQPSQS